MNKNESISEKQKDFLKELGNMGAGNALTSLSKLTQAKLKMGLPTVSVTAKADFLETLRMKDVDYIGMRVTASMDLDLAVFMLMSLESANDLLKLLYVPEIDSIEKMSEEQRSCIEEIGNILCNSYLNVFAALFHLNLQTSGAEIATGNCAEILNRFSMALDAEETETILVENEITSESCSDTIHIMFQPNQGSIRKVFDFVGE